MSVCYRKADIIPRAGWHRSDMVPRHLALKRSQHACTCSKCKMYSIVYSTWIWRWRYLKMECCYHQEFLYNYNNKTTKLKHWPHHSHFVDWPALFFLLISSVIGLFVCCVLSSHPALLLPTRAHFTSFSSHLPTFLQLASASSQLSINHPALECIFITYRELEHLLDSSESLAYFQI